jgi:hypothetical protein
MRRSDRKKEIQQVEGHEGVETGRNCGADTKRFSRWRCSKRRRRHGPSTSASESMLLFQARGRRSEHNLPGSQTRHLGA